MVVKSLHTAMVRYGLTSGCRGRNTPALDTNERLLTPIKEFNVGKNAKPMGTVTLRQTYSREGHNYLLVTIPKFISNAQGWKPGAELSFYPVKYDNGLTGYLLLEQSQVVGAAIPNLDVEKVEAALAGRVQSERGPKPGSIAAREVEIDDWAQSVLNPEEEAMARARRTGKAVKTGSRMIGTMRVTEMVDPNAIERWMSGFSLDQRVPSVAGKKGQGGRGRGRRDPDQDPDQD